MGLFVCLVTTNMTDTGNTVYTIHLYTELTEEANFWITKGPFINDVTKKGGGGVPPKR